jgi:D-glycero-alpha-D-manno-heptose-7-phosphate kinase
MARTEVKGSVRVDLVGGTLDIPPIHLILKDTVTLNLATSLQAKIVFEKTDYAGIEFHSIDYDIIKKFAESDFTHEKLAEGHFGVLRFLSEILLFLKATKGIKITLSSGAPTGSGLGGSSAMGVTFYKGLCLFANLPYEKNRAISEVRAIEAKVLHCGPTGYQDYYPALYGGVLALLPVPGGVEVEQYFSSELKTYLESHLLLIYSGESRLSGINNWEVFKGFFDNDPHIKAGLSNIAKVSQKAYQAVKMKDFKTLLAAIAEEGMLRSDLFPNILTPGMKEFYKKAREKFPELGLKVCGAGGGGCFLLTHNGLHAQEIKEFVKLHGMDPLEFSVCQPID